MPGVLEKQICGVLLGMDLTFAGSHVLITRERDINVIFTCPSRSLKSKHSFPQVGAEKKATAVAAVNMSGSTLLRLGGQITAFQAVCCLISITPQAS